MNSALKTLLFLCLAATVSTQNRPPSILVGPLKNEFYYGNIMLPCVASGTPPPKYEWFKDGIPFNLNQNGVSLSGGNLSIKASSAIEGYYQCSAKNAFGTARSNTSRLRQLKLDGTTAAGPQTRTAQSGSTLSLPCTLQPGQAVVPSAIYKWETVHDQDDPHSILITLDQRLQIDNNGTLTFAYVLPADQQNNRQYRCRLINTRQNLLETTVSYTYVIVDPPNPVQPCAMTNLFSYSWPTVALERGSVSLRCFFGGAQDISISWKKPDGSTPEGARYTFGKSLMQITGVQKSDEGTYTCTGTSSSLPSATATINVVVQSAPIFLNINDGPHDVDVTTGDNVIVNCDAYANPAPTVQWFRNGQPFDSTTLPRKFNLSPDMKTLTISNVCKSCSDGTIAASTDLMVIQCNASNVHGHSFANGYINVLDPTIIREPPQKKLDLSYPNPIIFTCSADTDVSTPVTYRWLLNGNERYDGSLNTTVPGTLYIDISNDDKRGADFLGTWTCNATNGVSYDTKTGELVTPSSSK